MTRSLNKVELIGNLTRDPELRYTPSGTAVCTFGLATNRGWTTESGEKKEDVEFHRIVAWQKLAELCSQLLSKGRKVYVEGRLQTRRWTGQDEVERQTTEVVISDMIILDSKYSQGGGDESFDVPDDPGYSDIEGGTGGSDSGTSSKKAKANNDTKASDSKGKSDKKVSKKDNKKDNDASGEDDDIPF